MKHELVRWHRRLLSDQRQYVPSVYLSVCGDTDTNNVGNGRVEVHQWRRFVDDFTGSNDPGQA